MRDVGHGDDVPGKFCTSDEVRETGTSLVTSMDDFPFRPVMELWWVLVHLGSKPLNWHQNCLEWSCWTGGV